ncbi:MAG: hypothetical protein ACREU4_02930 [Burkholderiales bacterium]
MDESASRLLIIGLIIAGLLLFNYFAQQMAKHARERQEALEREAPAPPAEEEMPEYIWGRRARGAACGSGAGANARTHDALHDDATRS